MSYRGDGKYDHSTLMLWQDIPDTEDHDHSLVEAPEGQGWWPVISIVWDPSFPFRRRRCGRLIICFYQLQSDELVAWWVGED